MKNSPMATVLLVILAISALISLILCWRFSANTVEGRRMNGELGYMQDRRTRTRALLQETIEYAKRNPKIEPVLESIGITNQPAPGTAPAPKPNGK